MECVPLAVALHMNPNSSHGARKESPSAQSRDDEEREEEEEIAVRSNTTQGPWESF
jgi:hypothetical protein